MITFSVAGTIAPATPLPPIADQVQIDATTSPGYLNAPVVNVHGGGSIATGLDLAAGSSLSEVHGLKVDGFTTAAISIASASVIVRRNHLGPVGGGTANQQGLVLLPSSSSCTIGGGTDGDGNVISGNTADGLVIRGTGHSVVDNFIGTNAAGTAALPNGLSGIALLEDATNVSIGAAGTGIENVVSGNTRNGINAFRTVNTTIINNIIGLNAAGNAAVPNGFEGVLDTGSSATMIGLPAAGNVISGNGSRGLEVNGGTASVRNNIVGLDRAGQFAIGNADGGILASGPITIGGSDPGEGNTVSGNLREGIGINVSGDGTRIYGNTIGLNVDRTAARGNIGHGVRGSNIQNNVIRRNSLGGVGVAGDPTTVAITENSIVSNSGLGIDLQENGVTANDPADADTGPNGLQNFPVITSAVTTGSASWIEGTLNSTPNTLFSLHFYNNTAADPSGYGEGETYVGTIDVTTDAAGNASFVRNGAPLAAGWLTATATGPTGTSEFSAANGVAAAPEIHFSQASYTTDEMDGVVTITVVREGDLSGTSTVDYATADDTATAGSDYTPANGTLTFLPGQSSATFDVTILPDAFSEPTERFNVALSNPNAATLTIPSNAIVTIAAPAEVPTVSMWGLLALIAALAAVTLLKMR